MLVTSASDYGVVYFQQLFYHTQKDPATYKDLDKDTVKYI